MAALGPAMNKRRARMREADLCAADKCNNLACLMTTLCDAIRCCLSRHCKMTLVEQLYRIPLIRVVVLCVSNQLLGPNEGWLVR